MSDQPNTNKPATNSNSPDSTYLNTRITELLSRVRQNINSDPNREVTIDHRINLFRLVVKDADDHDLFTLPLSSEERVAAFEAMMEKFVEEYTAMKVRQANREMVEDRERLKHMVGEVPVEGCVCRVCLGDGEGG